MTLPPVVHESLTVVYLDGVPVGVARFNAGEGWVETFTRSGKLVRRSGRVEIKVGSCG